MSVKMSLRIATAAAASVLFSGCMDGPSDPVDSGKLRKGMPIDSILGARAAALVGRTLYVANRDPEAPGIAALDVETDRIVAFYPEILPPNGLAALGDSQLVIVETDYAVGAISLLDLRTKRLETSYSQIDGDNAISSDGDMAFLFQKTLGTVSGFRNGRWERGNVFFDVQTGVKSNPYNLALAGNTAFITRYGSASLLVVDADKLDGGSRDSIDLSAFAASPAPGAVPHMDGIVRHGSQVFVAVQRLTGFQAVETSKIVVIDLETRAVKDSIALNFRNPIAVASWGKYLYVTGIDGYGTYQGGVERIDMERGVNEGVVVAEADLPGPSDAYDFIPVSDTKGYVIYASDFKISRIKAVTLP